MKGTRTPGSPARRVRRYPSSRITDEGNPARGLPADVRSSRVNTAAVRDPWWTEWFGEGYLAAYPARDDFEARRHAAFVSRLLGAAASAGQVAFLDLAFSTGRHAVVLSGGGGVAGIDGSLSRLGEARRREKTPSPGFAQGDIRRLPFRSAIFGAVVSFFPTIGTFESAEDDVRILREVRRVLAPGGVFLASGVNSERLLSALATQEEKTIAGRRISIRRRFRPPSGRLEKEIRVWSGSAERLFRHEVRVSSLADLRSLFRKAGFEEPDAMGDFDGRPFRPLRSDRLVLLARRAESE